MIDNFNIILPLLNFESEDDFYYLQILQRKKENSSLGSNSRVIKNYYINSVDHLIKRKQEIINLCNFFNARASLRLNKRSYKKVAFRAMQNLANTISNGEFGFVSKSYDRACGECHNDKNKTWILDIDGMGDNISDIILFVAEKCEPDGEKFVAILPSKNGIHIITRPFNTEKFKQQFPIIEIHKDNPTNLYIP
jgi:hypothetical protein